MIFYCSPKEDLSVLLEYLPLGAKITLTRLLLSKRISKADDLMAGNINHPHFDMSSFINTKSIFVHIPKAAGRSIRKQIYNGVTCSHTTVYWYSLALRSLKISSFFIYTIVRNPWDRLHSAYYFLRKGGAHKGDAKLFESHLSKYHSFESFVLDMAPKGIPPIVHMKPMHNFLELRNGKSPVNYVGYYEDLDNAYRYILSRIPGINDEKRKASSLCHENSNTLKKTDYRNEYTSQMIDIVADIYSRDIKLFGYSFDSFSREDALFKPTPFS